MHLSCSVSVHECFASPCGCLAEMSNGPRGANACPHLINVPIASVAGAVLSCPADCKATPTQGPCACVALLTVWMVLCYAFTLWDIWIALEQGISGGAG
jgi:hypothetical protein